MPRDLSAGSRCRVNKSTACSSVEWREDIGHSNVPWFLNKNADPSKRYGRRRRWKTGQRQESMFVCERGTWSQGIAIFDGQRRLLQDFSLEDIRGINSFWVSPMRAGF